MGGKIVNNICLSAIQKHNGRCSINNSKNFLGKLFVFIVIIFKRHVNVGKYNKTVLQYVFHIFLASKNTFVVIFFAFFPIIMTLWTTAKLNVRVTAK